MRLELLLMPVLACGCATVSAPRPSGTQGVGMTRFEVTAPFDDPYAASPTPRQVPVQAWYPADARGGAAVETPESEVREAFGDLGVPKFLIPTGTSHAVPDAPAAPGRYPVLIFNHGFTSYQSQSASLMEDLASHGFVVLSVGHPSESLVTRFSDGRVVKMRRDLPAVRTVVEGLKHLEAQVKEVAPLIARARAARSAPELRAAMVGLVQHPSYAVLAPVMELWVRDTRAVIDALGRLDDGTLTPRLAGRIDADHLGVFGHSLGGMVSGVLAMTDERVKAAMSYDGAQLVPPGSTAYQLQAPTCFLYADTTKVGKQLSADEGMNDALVVDGPPGSCGATLRNTTHLDFADSAHWPLFASAVGKIDRTELQTVLRAMTLGFFEHHLKGAPLTGFMPSATLHVRWSPMPRGP